MDDGAFDWIGTTAFSGTAGELHQLHDAAGIFAEGDVTATGDADFQIATKVPELVLTADNIVL